MTNKAIITPTWTKKTTLITITALAFLFLMTNVGCAAKYGRIDGDAGINSAFEAHRVLPGYQYYYNGPENEPWVILGVKNEYVLEQGLWKKVALTSKQLKAWVEEMNIDPTDRIRPFGAVIRDHAGKEIGVWYSPWNWTTVKRGTGGKVIIYTPSFSPSMEKDRSERY